VLYHVVLLKLKSEKAAQLDSLLEELRELRGLPMVVSLACGRDVAAAGYDAALVVAVAGPDELAAYRSHPAHQPVLARLRDACEALAVVDFDPS
jgi:Stress responsive A/B Barrel Domain